ncbi:MAG: hypothetical protein PCFJNLEI_02703 [Verrucomicrobiae bacterium]|nr:hypothetical protein [Verrucomicrobiae bacterium]
MRVARAIIVYAVAVVLLGALLAPWLFWLVQWLAANSDFFANWTRHPFKRIFNRSLLIVALAGLWPLLRSLGYRSWNEIGYPRRAGWWREFAAGLVLGVCSLSLAALVAGKALDWADFTPALVGKLCVTALVVAVIEETFFRGGLQGGLQRGMPWQVALVVASVIYSALHFMKPTGVRLAAADVTWMSGFEWVRLILANNFTRPEVLTGFVTLCVAGGLLGWGFVKTGALYFSIGLHAGWVLANELVRELGGGNVTENWRTWPVMVVLGLVIWRWPKRS